MFSYCIKSFFCFVCLLLTYNTGFGSIVFSLHGAQSNGCANASSTVSDLWAITNNQAGLGFYDSFTIGASHESRYMLQELSLQGVALSIPTHPGTFGFMYSSFGYSLYNEKNIKVCFGKKLFRNFSAGISIDYFNTSSIHDRRNRGELFFEAGILAVPLENLSVGVHVFNPSQSKFNNTEDHKIPTVFKLGLSYQIKDLLICIESEKEVDYPNFLKAGIEYGLFNNLFLRSGITVDPSGFYFGLGYEYKKLCVDVAMSRHCVLGYSPCISASYKLK